ncbi:MAG: DUF5412 domain-containing protein [Planococcus sp. (in: firmicutes)]|uniref:DUF5412 domain-containing protein n=1 Tax=Planococcus halocryophilus TaxID=1215089 RepID=UPI001F0D2CBE|nr:DUF5412 domain-containing protein [Planococcus halocryophilus]MCH4825842.1 DUF5412 domain-containing protein [Planococcus halocryophilus]
MKKFLLISLSGFLIISGLLGYGIYWAFFDMQRLPEGRFLTEAVSPDGDYTVRAYVTDGGGATVAFSVRAELVFNDEDKRKKNIYWAYREETATINWIDNNTVEINGRHLNVPSEKYDFRNN